MSAEALEEYNQQLTELEKVLDQPQAFEIDSADKADWLLAKYAAIDAEIATVQAQADAIKARLLTDRAQLENRFQPGLEHWARQQIEADPKKRKSIILLHGTCQFRKVPMSVKVADELEAMRHCHAVFEPEHVSELIHAEEHLDKKAYIAWFKSTGELLPGIEVTPEHETFKVTWAKEKEADDYE